MPGERDEAICRVVLGTCEPVQGADVSRVHGTPHLAAVNVVEHPLSTTSGQPRESVLLQDPVEWLKAAYRGGHAKELEIDRGDVRNLDAFGDREDDSVDVAERT